MLIHISVDTTSHRLRVLGNDPILGGAANRTLSDINAKADPDIYECLAKICERVKSRAAPLLMDEAVREICRGMFSAPERENEDDESATTKAVQAATG